MYKAIKTQYYGPRNFPVSRIVASDSDNNRITVPYNDGMSNDENHRKAAYALRDKMGWRGELIDGGVKDGRVWVFLPPLNNRALEAFRAALESAKHMMTEQCVQHAFKQHGNSSFEAGYVRGYREAMEEMGLLTAAQIDALEREIFNS